MSAQTYLVQTLSRVRRSNFYRVFVPNHVKMGGAVIPAKHLRLGGEEFKNDRYFLASSKAEARRLVAHCGLREGFSVLDIGCGVGRLPIGIVDQIGDGVRYWGVDVDPRCVRWCNEHIQKAHPNFKFLHIHVRNRRYNPKGTPMTSDFQLPFESRSVQVVYLYSVFSHMLPEDIDAYLTEFHRILAPRGVVFLTAFIEEGVPDFVENPVSYKMNWKGALHCVRYDKSFFTQLIALHGFQMTRFEYSQETDGQSGVYLLRP
jgi:ubiquinone/menaquinone biosynthesis C-methylase UbiE